MLAYVMQDKNYLSTTLGSTTRSPNKDNKTQTTKKPKRLLKRTGLRLSCAERKQKKKTQKTKKPKQDCLGFLRRDPGGDLLSHTKNHAVPSAQRGLTTEFGMGSGVTLSLRPPGIEQRVTVSDMKLWVLRRDIN